MYMYLFVGDIILGSIYEELMYLILVNVDEFYNWFKINFQKKKKLNLM